MARIRTIKPEFFTSDDIVSLSPLARLLYIALWCEADREGRLTWKPATFKLRYLPGDAVDIYGLCDEIINQGLVNLYGDGLAVIPTFLTHQHVNPRESISKLPNPDACPTRADASNLDMHAQVGREGEGRERKELKAIVPSDPAAAPLLAHPAKQDCPHQDIIAIYHEVLPQCPKVRDWTLARATQLRARWNEDPGRQNLDYWRRFFEYAGQCDFLMGRTAKPFFADLEWMTKSGNFTKIREEKYENRGNA
jgi:hypothetical protein